MSSGTRRTLLSIAVGGDQQVAMEVAVAPARRSCPRWPSNARRRARCSPRQAHRLRGDAIRVGVMVGGAVKYRTCRGSGCWRRRPKLVHETRRRAQNRLALSTILAKPAGPAASAWVFHHHGVDLGAASQQATMAGLFGRPISTRLPGLTPVV